MCVERALGATFRSVNVLVVLTARCPWISELVGHLDMNLTKMSRRELLSEEGLRRNFVFRWLPRPLDAEQFNNCTAVFILHFEDSLDISQKLHFGADRSFQRQRQHFRKRCLFCLVILWTNLFIRLTGALFS